MVIHAVFIKLKKTSDCAIVSREIAELCQSSVFLESFRLTEVDRTTADLEASLLILMELKALEDVDAFLESEAHQRVAATVRPLIEELWSWDSTSFDPLAQR